MKSKNYSYFFVVIFLLTSIIGHSKSDIHIKPIGSTTLYIGEILNYFSENKNLYNLLLVADRIFGVAELHSHSSNPKKGINEIVVCQAIKAKMLQGNYWQEKLSSEQIILLTKNKKLLREKLKPESIEWAWISYQLGEKDLSKRILKATFNKEYNSIIQLKTAKNFQGIHTSRLILIRVIEVLDVLLDKKEMKTLKEKLEKARIHVDKLPGNFNY
jgi:hypothetical protein